MKKWKVLYAPWRIGYILGEKIKGCLFCKLVKQKNDKKNLILERKKKCFVILNRYPYNNGHLMIVPYKHTDDLTKLDKETLAEMMETAKEYTAKMKKVMRTDGFNIGINMGQIAGAGIADHLHLHIVPRWAGDNNFMPVIGGSKVISESFESVYKKLKK
ncbi:MAG: HIT domain-containing protein [Spirochaetes bacterium]|nr:HIT domain-containing protein [Spirochaetota bacterium]